MFTGFTGLAVVWDGSREGKKTASPANRRTNTLRALNVAGDADSHSLPPKGSLLQDPVHGLGQLTELLVRG